jgi:hypothetical protein
MTWALGDARNTALLPAYEALLNQDGALREVLALCHYDRARFSPAILRDVLRAHPMVTLRGCTGTNHYYEPPDQAPRALERMLDHLRRTAATSPLLA